MADQFEINPNSEKLEDLIENSILIKLKNYFDLHKKLKYEQLNDFLESTDLGYVFGTDDEKEFIWGLFLKISDGATEIDYNACKEGITELLRGNLEKDNYHSEGKYASPSSPSNIYQNLRESLHNKEKIDVLITRISLKNSSEKIAHYNTPMTEKNEKGKLIENGMIGESDSMNGMNCTKRKRKPKHERKITKMFTEIDINKLQQLRKAFSLLDLRNKEFVYVSDIQECIRKYKFIKLSQDELINFLSLISDDLIQNNNSNNIQKLSINFELYSRAMAAIEQQLLKVNSDLFTEENNDSYGIINNYEEMINDLNNMEQENVDYIMIQADIIKSIEMLIFEMVIENYEKLLHDKKQGHEMANQLNENIKEGVDYFKSKLKDMNIFLKEMNRSSVKKQNKLEYLKIIVNSLETNFKNTEEDYKALYQKINSSEPMEISDETERLLEENIYLQQQKEVKEARIEELEKEIDLRGEQIFNLESEINNCKMNENEMKKNYNILKKEHETIKKNYDTLLNDVYEKIIKEEENANGDWSGHNSVTSNKSSKSKPNPDHINNHSPSDKETISKLKEKLILNEENKKIFDMNHEQLLIYTLNIETFNKQLEEKNNKNERRIKDLEEEVAELKKINSENSKTNHLLKSENSRLQLKINDLNKDIQFNQSFRPSNVLGTRISKMDDRNSKLSEIHFGAANRFKKMEKLFEKEPIKDESKQINPRISDLNFAEINSGQSLRKPNKLEQIENSQISFNPNPNKNINITQNFNPNTKSFVTISSSIEPISLTNTAAIFSGKESFSFNDQQFLDETKINKSIGEYYIDKNPVNKNINLNIRKDTIVPERRESISYKGSVIEDKISIRNLEKEVNVDVLEDNPFSIKDDENNEEEDHDNSVNIDKIAIHSPFKPDLNLDKREDLKRIKENILISSINNTSIKNPPNQRRLPSQITEEILEEDMNGEIIGTGIRNSNLPTRTSQLLSRNSNQYSSISTQGDSKSKLYSHARNDTCEDIALIFNKDSQYVCYDFLTLRKTEGILKILEDNHEDVSSYEMFSDNVYLIDENNKKSKKYLFITSNHVYILRPYDLTIKIKICLRNLDKLSISNKNCNLIAFHFKDKDDILLEILRRMELLYYFRDLYKMKSYGKLRFKYSDNFKIKRNNAYSNIIVDQANNFFIAPNFDSAQKLGYLSKLTGTFFTKFNEKLVVLTNVGLLYFDDPNKPPKKLIPIIGSEIIRIDEKRYKKKHCFEIKTLNGENYVFAANSNEEMESWIKEFKTFKNNYENKIKNIDPSKK